MEERLGRYVSRWYKAKAIASRKVFYSQIHLTDRCQYRCSHCYFGELGRVSADMSLDMLESIFNWVLSSAGSLGRYPRIDLTGGDPFLATCFSDALQLCRESKCVFGIKSNPDAIVALGVEGVRDVLRGCDSVSLSLDGLRRFHDELRGRTGSFDSVISAAHILNEANIRLRLSTTVSRQNADQVVPLLRYLAAEDVIVSAYTFARYWSLESWGLILRRGELIGLFDECSLYLQDYLSCSSSYSDSCDRELLKPKIAFSFKEHLWFPYFAEKGLLDSEIINMATKNCNVLNCSALGATVVADVDGALSRCRKSKALKLSSSEGYAYLKRAEESNFIGFECDSCFYRNACCGCPSFEDYFMGPSFEPCPFYSRK